jgi:tubulin delta
VGEIAVQNYNSALSLANLIEVSDGVVLIENEKVSKTCTSLLKIAQPSFSDLNSVIARHLSGALLPSLDRHHTPSQSFAHLTGNPTYKFLTSRMVPSVPEQSLAFSSDSWSALNKRLFQMNISDAFLESDIDWGVSTEPSSRSVRAPIKSVANVLTLHGDGAQEALALPEARLFEQSSLYPAWSDATMFCYRPQRFNAHSKASTLLSNSQAVIRPLDTVTSRGHDMFTSRAYVHQYLGGGLELDDFSFAFSRLEQALFDYRGL